MSRNYYHDWQIRLHDIIIKLSTAVLYSNHCHLGFPLYLPLKLSAAICGLARHRRASEMSGDDLNSFALVRNTNRVLIFDAFDFGAR